MLRRYGQEEILSVEDVTPFVKDQAQRLTQGIEELTLPEERVYTPDPAAAQAAGIDVIRSEPTRQEGNH
jgi:hypothetical protein